MGVESSNGLYACVVVISDSVVCSRESWRGSEGGRREVGFRAILMANGSVSFRSDGR